MTPFDTFASRSQRKIDLSNSGSPTQELQVECYLQSLDQFRFTTASPPLPLPLRTMHYEKDVEAADAIHQILTLADADQSNLPKILPTMITGSEPIYRVARQYKSRFGGPIQDTLIINMPLDKASCPQRSWNQNVRDIQTRLNALTKFSFETDIPHNIARFDVEIRDDDRCFNPSREIFAPGDQLSNRYKDYAEVFYSAEQALRDMLRASLDLSFLDVSLELQENSSSTCDQKAIVIEVLPHTSHCWAKLRGRVLDFMQDFSASAKGLVPPTFEVEFSPLYETEISKAHKAVELQAIRNKAPDILICESFAQNIYDTPKVRLNFRHHLKLSFLSCEDVLC